MRDRLPKGIQKLLRTGEVLADRLEMSAYVVGGFVRDLLLGIPNFDVDMVVEGDGIQFGKALAADLQTRAKTHERFGTASLKIPSQSDFPAECSLDIATARTEYYEYPTALPNVERSSIKKDLYRRDFTLNTLAVRLNKRPGELLDFFGGQRDIKDKTIRVLHSLSFIEDPTRVFRAIRFEQRFGFKISKETTAFIHSAVTMELFHRLSGHRLGDELIHLLSEPFPGKGLQRLKEFDLLKFIHPDLEWNVATSRLFQNIAEVLTWHRLEFPDEQVQEWVLYAMAFFESVEKASVQNTWTRLGFAEGSKRMAVAFFKEQNRLSRSLAQAHLLPDQVYSLLKPWPVEPLLFLMAKTHPPSPPALTMQRVRQYLSTFRFVKSSVTGRDLQKYGLRKGPAYALVLNQILSACLNGEVHSREEELALAQSLVAKKQRSLRKSQTC
jgi:tRNA nucleotidyltransferase (CCA-adding enzyme)